MRVRPRRENDETAFLHVERRRTDVSGGRSSCFAWRCALDRRLGRATQDRPIDVCRPLPRRPQRNAADRGQSAPRRRLMNEEGTADLPLEQHGSAHTFGERAGATPRSDADLAHRLLITRSNNRNVVLTRATENVHVSSVDVRTCWHLDCLRNGRTIDRPCHSR